MAPRKTKTAAEPAPNAEDAALAVVSQQIEKMGAEGIALIEEAERQVNGSMRFQVALALMPTMIQSFGILVHPEGDENEKGACARVAFEYADAFIAQSRKGQVDDAE